jgi:hypothetical protein
VLRQSEVSLVCSAVQSEAALTRLVAVNNIDGRQSMVGVPALYLCCGVTYKCDMAYLPSCGGRLLGGVPAAVWLLLALSGA